MEPFLIFFQVLLFFFFFDTFSATSQSTNTNATDFSCSSASRCDTYVAYRTQAPYFLDLGNVSDLFGVSRGAIMRKNSLPSEDVVLPPGQLLFVPISCGCTGGRSFANVTYEIKAGDSFYLVSVNAFERLTNYSVAMDLNPTLEPTKLKVGQEVVFPIFCRCPTKAQSDQGFDFLLTYAWQKGDDVSALSSTMNTSPQAFAAANGYRNMTDAVGRPVLIPVRALPRLPIANYYNSTTASTTLGVGEESTTTKSRSRPLLIASVLLGSVLGLVLLSFLASSYFRRFPESRRLLRVKSNTDATDLLRSKGSASSSKAMADKLLTGVTEYIDRPVLFQTDAIMEATMNLHERFRLGGARVYRAALGGEVYAVKLVQRRDGGGGDDDAELSILRRVNHANLVRLAGVSTETDEGFFMVYEFAQNGSLDQWLYPDSPSSGRFLSWERRLAIALDVANGLHYMHEHTTPSVVHGCIRTSNVLLDAGLKAKISNLSKARPASELATPAMDVLRFGVVLLELLSGGRGGGGDARVVLPREIRMVLEAKEEAEERVKRWMDPSLGGLYPSDGALSLAVMARACTSEVAAERPSMAEIVFSLSVLAHSSGGGDFGRCSKPDSGEHTPIVKHVVAR